MHRHEAAVDGGGIEQPPPDVVTQPEPADGSPRVPDEITQPPSPGPEPEVDPQGEPRHDAA